MDIATAHLIPVGSTLTDRYWTVPGHYGEGERFGSEEEALAFGIAEREASSQARALTIDFRWTVTFPARHELGLASGTDFVAGRTTYDTLDDARAHLARIRKFKTAA